MNEVLRESFQLPTVIFTLLIGVALILWIISLAGFGDADDAADGLLEGVLSPMGLAGVPANVLVSLFALFGWATSALLSVTVLDTLGGTAAIIAGLAIGIAGVVVALLVMRALAPRLTKAFRPTLAHGARELVGRTVEIRSAVATQQAGYGDVRLADGTIDRVDVRLRPDRAEQLTLHVGDAALIIDYDSENHLFIIDELPL